MARGELSGDSDALDTTSLSKPLPALIELVCDLLYHGGLRSCLDVGCGLIIVQQPRRDSQRVYLLFDYGSFLLFGPKHLVRIFHHFP